jgi:Tfp pilus assembly protein PilV
MLGAAAEDRGESLIEILVSLVIMGIAIAALVTGLAGASRSSALNRDQADANTLVARSVEAVKAAPYYGTNCDQAAARSAYEGAFTTAGVTLPTGWTRTVTVAWWTFGTDSDFSSDLSATSASQLTPVGGKPLCREGAVISTATVSSVSATSGFTTIGASGTTPAISEQLRDMQVRFLSGAAQGQARRIHSASASASTIETPAFAATVAVGDTFTVEHRPFARAQRVTLQVVSPAGERESLDVLKRYPS